MKGVQGVFQAPEDIQSFSFSKFVVTHLGITPQSLILDQDDQMWIIGWGGSGAYPPVFEARHCQAREISLTLIMRCYPLFHVALRRNCNSNLFSACQRSGICPRGAKWKKTAHVMPWPMIPRDRLKEFSRTTRISTHTCHTYRLARRITFPAYRHVCATPTINSTF